MHSIISNKYNYLCQKTKRFLRISHDSEADKMIYDDDTRIDTDRLRSDLLDCFGTAAFSVVIL